MDKKGLTKKKDILYMYGYLGSKHISLVAAKQKRGILTVAMLQALSLKHSKEKCDSEAATHKL